MEGDGLITAHIAKPLIDELLILRVQDGTIGKSLLHPKVCLMVERTLLFASFSDIPHRHRKTVVTLEGV